MFLLPLALSFPLLAGWLLLVRQSLRRRDAWARVARRADALRRARLLASAPERRGDLAAGPAVVRGVLRAPKPRSWRIIVSMERAGKHGSPLSRKPTAPSGAELDEELVLELDRAGDRDDAAAVAIRIAAPLRVVVGSRQRFGKEVFRTVFCGDRLIARGVLESNDRGGDYRTSAEQTWTLRPLGDAVLLATEADVADELRTTALDASAACVLWGGPRWARYAMAMATLVVLGLYARGVWHDVRASQCARAPRCASEGLCGARWTASMAEIGFSCAATEDRHCADSAACSQDNRCAAGASGVCQPLDCSRRCQSSGDCVPRGNLCVASSDEDCAKSWQCQQRGLCTERGGRCTLTVDERKDCSNNITCRSHGHCSSTPKGCLAATRADCEGSEGCRARGRCSPDGVGLCRAQRDQDCARSDVCRRLGFCTAVDGGCALSAYDTCGASTECDYRAKCTKRGNQCLPTRNEHCELSLLCATDERCRLVGEECVK